ncbi:MAG: aldehyde dehydrogenase family protein, partial [Aquidulcibacter sp.]
MREIHHFIDGQSKAANTGRFHNVYDPSTGKVQALVELASAEFLAEAVAGAKKAQSAWAATNPQKRARVMFAFKGLLERDMEDLARLLSSEHGKTVPDAKGDIQRGLEVIEFACGIPHLLKGEFTEGAGPGI